MAFNGALIKGKNTKVQSHVAITKSSKWHLHDVNVDRS